MGIRRLFGAALVATLWFAGSATALVPETGLWGGVGEDGRGLSIEIQDDNMFVTYYGYESDGVKSAFYTSLGKYNPGTGVMIGYFAAARNGQCYGCPPRSPQLTDLGQVRFEFTTRIKGRMFLPGVAQPINIDRSVLRGSPIDLRDELYGTWTETHGALGLYFGDILWFRLPYDSATTTNGFSGTRFGTNRQLLGTSGTGVTAGTTFVLIDSSASYYTAIAFMPNIDHWVGQTWTYLKTSSISGSGLTSFGNRTLGRVYSEMAATSAPASLAASWADTNVAAEESAGASAAATAAAAVGGNPQSVLIDEDTLPFAVIQQKFAEMEAQMRLSQ